MRGEIEPLAFDALVKELLYAGYNLELSPNGHTSTQLVVEVKEARMTTYDLLFTRLVHSEVILELTWRTLQDGRAIHLPHPLIIQEKRRSYISLPFSRRLSKELQKTISQALKKGLSMSRLA
jgi:hypothetical protein